ncbi:MAG: hypothetical protein ACI88H_000037 [Cocleimonas sp.]|jgi:hypothetical protein
MIISITFIQKTLITSILLLSSVTAMAGPGIGTMTMTFGGANIPSLSGIMLVFLSLLLFAIAFRTAKQKQRNKFFVALISSGALLAVLGGAGQLKNNLDVQAGWILLLPTIGFDQTNTTRPINPGATEYENEEIGLIGTITNITITGPGYTCDGVGVQRCTVGISLSPNESCSLVCRR